MPGNIILRRHDETDFYKLRAEWQLLISESGQDALFMGWDWQYTWWQQWARDLNLELLLLAAYENNRLIGLAPMYLSSEYFPSFLKTRTLHFIGDSRNIVDTVRTEYIDFIISSEFERTVRSTFLAYIEDQLDWDQFIISDMEADSGVTKDILKNRYFRQDSVRIVHEDKTTIVRTSGSYDDYKSKLGKNTRYRIFNRRKTIQNMSGYKEDYATDSTVTEFFEQLNELHLGRWGAACFSGNILNFHINLAKKLMKSESVSFSRLSINHRPISLLYDLSIGNKKYNIQSAFDDNFKKNFSLGLVHLGIAIEQAFNSKNIESFDLLAGKGKNTYYKSSFDGGSVKLISLQIIRKKTLKISYFLYDNSPALIKNAVKKLYNKIR